MKLKPRLTANATIYTLTKDNVLTVPNKALRFTPNKDIVGGRKINDCQSSHKVWTLDNNTFTAHPVKIGITDGSKTEIVSGITENTPVVTETVVKGAMPGMEEPSAGEGERSPFMPGPPGSNKKKEQVIKGNASVYIERINHMKKIIELQNIKRNFQVGDETVHALRGISFTIYEGEFVTIMGTSGSGKSTLLNTLGCLDTPTSGEYLLDGVSVRTMSKPQRAVLRNRKIGFVFQNYNLLPKTTAVENVELPLMYNSSISASERRKRAIESLIAVGLGDRLEHKSTKCPADRCSVWPLPVLW